MAEDIKPSDDAKIVPADYSLSKKIGGVGLNKIISTTAVKEAENVITESAGDFYAECVAEVETLSEYVVNFKKAGSVDAAAIMQLVDTAFAAKTKAGLSGYELVVALAASLQIYCEKISAHELDAKAIQIILWHAQSMKQLLATKIKGDGGEAGKAILAEVEKINSR